jgi:hypothetical protein
MINWVASNQKERPTDALYDRRLLALPDVHHFQQPPVALAQVENVTEHLVDKVLQPFERDDGWDCRSQRLEEDGLDGVEVLHVLVLLADELVDDPGMG